MLDTVPRTMPSPQASKREVEEEATVRDRELAQQFSDSFADSSQPFSDSKDPWASMVPQGSADMMRVMQDRSHARHGRHSSAGAAMARHPYPLLGKQPIRPKIGRSCSTSAGDRPGTCPVGNRAPANPYAAAPRPGTVQSGTGRKARADWSDGGEKPGPKPPRLPKSRPATVPTNVARPRRRDPSRPARPTAAADLDAGSVATTFMEMSPPPGVSDAVMAEYKMLRADLETGCNSEKGVAPHPRSAGSLKPAKDIYSGRTSSTRPQHQRNKPCISDQKRKSAAAWRNRQEGKIAALELQRAKEAELVSERVKVAEKKARELKTSLGVAEVQPRYNDQPVMRKTVVDERVDSPGSEKGQKDKEQKTSDQKVPMVQSMKPSAAQQAANRAIRARQEQLLQQTAKQKEQERQTARLAQEQQEAMKRVAQDTVLSNIAALRAQGAMDDKDRQKQERAHAKWSKDEGGQLGRAIATQPSSWGQLELNNPQMTDSALERWRNRYGVPSSTPVFIADLYGEQVARKLQARGWARNTLSTSSTFNFLFVRRGNDVPHNSMSHVQVANHLRSGDVLTIKSGLHDCMHSLKKSIGRDPATFYPRSYYFGPGEKDRQMRAFVDDFKNCTATALLWTAATSPDGEYIGGGAGKAIRVLMDWGLLELCLTHIRWRLRTLGAWSEAARLGNPESKAGRKFGSNDVSSSRLSPELKEPSCKLARPRLPPSSPVTDSQWDAIAHHFSNLRGIARLAAVPSLGELQQATCHSSGPCSDKLGSWKNLRKRMVDAIASLQAADPQAKLNGPANAWVIKPCGAARGEGVKVLGSMDRIISELKTGPPRIVQKYIERPLLLDRRKADLRVWIVVLSFEPLIAYMYEQVMVRPAGQEFTLLEEQLGNTSIHLCNHAVQSSQERKRGRAGTADNGSPSPDRRGSPSRTRSATMRSQDMTNNAALASRPATSHESMGSPNRPSPLGSSSQKATAGGTSLFSKDRSAAGGTVVATVENGHIKYFSLNNPSGVSVRQVLEESAAKEVAAASSAATEMISIHALLPYIAATCPDGEIETSESTEDEEMAADSKRQHGGLFIDPPQPDLGCDSQDMSISPCSPNKRKSAAIWANGMTPSPKKANATLSRAGHSTSSTPGNELDTPVVKCDAQHLDGPTSVAEKAADMETSDDDNVPQSSIWANGMTPSTVPITEQSAQNANDDPADGETVSPSACKIAPTSDEGTATPAQSVWANGMTPITETRNDASCAPLGNSSANTVPSSVWVNGMTALEPGSVTSMKAIGNSTEELTAMPAEGKDGGTGCPAGKQSSESQGRSSSKEKSGGIWAKWTASVGKGRRVPKAKQSPPESTVADRKTGSPVRNISSAAEGPAQALLHRAGTDPAPLSVTDPELASAVTRSASWNEGVTGNTENNYVSAVVEDSPFAKAMAVLEGDQARGWLLWERKCLPAMKHAAIAALRSVAASHRAQDSPNRPSHTFELYGLDFLLDGSGDHCWLLEVNESPDLRFHSAAKESACSAMLDDLLDLVTGHIPVPEADCSSLDGDDDSMPSLSSSSMNSAWFEPPKRLGGWTRIARQ